MNVQMVVERSVTRPTPQPLGSSVLDHATVVPTDRFGLRNNEGVWPSYNCLDTLVPTPYCPDPLAEGFVKTFAFAEWQPAFEFAVHGGVQCKAIGLDMADQKAELARVFAANEGKGVELALLANRFVAKPGWWDAPVDLTPGAVSVQVALALLEGYAAANYAGVPTIHMPRTVASLLGDRLVWTDGKAFTRSGTKVACGGGYDDPTVPLSPSAKMFVTGEVWVEASSTIEEQQIVIPGDGSGTGSDENGVAENSVIALNERLYRVAVDCFAAQVTAVMWS